MGRLKKKRGVTTFLPFISITTFSFNFLKPFCIDKKSPLTSIPVLQVKGLEEGCTHTFYVAHTVGND